MPKKRTRTQTKIRLVKYDTYLFKNSITNITVVIENVTTLHKSIIDSQRKINSKKTATIQKVQCDSTVISAERENILLPHRHHQDFKDVVANVCDVKTLLSKIKLGQYDAVEKRMSTMVTCIYNIRIIT